MNFKLQITSNVIQLRNLITCNSVTAQHCLFDFCKQPVVLSHCRTGIEARGFMKYGIDIVYTGCIQIPHVCSAAFCRHVTFYIQLFRCLLSRTK